MSSPMKQNHKLPLDSSVILDNPSTYRHLVGRLIYLTIIQQEIVTQFIFSLNLCTNLTVDIGKLLFVSSDILNMLLDNIFFCHQILIFISILIVISIRLVVQSLRALTRYFILLSCSPISGKLRNKNLFPAPPLKLNPLYGCYCL